MLTELEKKIIASIQEDIPVSEYPYTEIADDLGITEDKLLKTLEELMKKGVIRRFGATLRHQKSGYSSNAMVAWLVDGDRIDVVGAILASHREVTHCYQRTPHRQWPYNLYTMVHASDESACLEVVRRLAAKAQTETFTVLFSRRELKKTSMQYIAPDENDSFSES